MIRQLMATTALATLLATSAYAQTNNAANNNTAATTSTATSGANLNPTMDPSAHLASNLIGMTVYSGTGDNADKIGKVDDLVVSPDGAIQALVIGVGGFLGMGEKDVAVSFDSAQLTQTDGDDRLVVQTTADALKAQTAFDRSAYTPKRVGTSAAAGADNNMMAANNTAGTAMTAAGTSDNPTAPTAADFADVKATEFATTAASSDMFEIQSSELAQQKAADAGVKSFAQQMIADHTKASNELKAAAAKAGVSPPSTMMPKHADMLDQVSSAGDGKAFDKQYVTAQLMGHEEAVALFTAYSENGDQPDLKAFAAKTLPTLQHHLMMVQDLRQKGG